MRTPESSKTDATLHERWWRLLERFGKGSFDPRALDNWDADFVRLALPVIRTIRDRYYRGTVDGLERLPDGPCLLVGNHGGGPMTVLADNLVLFASYYEWNQVRAPLYVMAHRIAFFLGPIGRLMAKFGAVDADRETARRILRAGLPFVVYPAGEEEMSKRWIDRNRVDFLGHAGFVDMALETGAPIIPIGSVGGHETEIVLRPGKGIAEKLRLRKWVGLKTFPVALTLPWGLTVGYWPYLPYPARIRFRIGKPIRLRPSQQVLTDPERREKYRQRVRDHVQKEVQRLVDELLAER